MINWLLYNLTPRDATGELIRAWFKNGTDIQNAKILSVTFSETPQDFFYALSSVNIFGTATAQQPIKAGIILLSPSEQIWQAQQRTNYGVPASGTGQYMGSAKWEGSPICLVPPRTRITLFVEFEAAAVNNQIICGHCGVMVPRGNISLSL